ncbi:MAG: cryptochrome/photolyase family protein, partial [Halapricum sp.]
DQLNADVGPLASRPDDSVLMIEATEFARKLPYHPHKLTLVFSAMRHFRDKLRNAGRTVAYRQVGTFSKGIADHLEAHPGDDLVVMRPPSHRGDVRLHKLVEDHDESLQIVENELFLCPRPTFEEWAGDRSSYRHEDFYRFMRRETGYLMTGDEPVGGEWNYDEQNRETPPDDYAPSEPPAFEPDEMTREVESWVEKNFEGSYEAPPYGGEWTDPGPFRWPVTHEQALAALEAFVTDRLDGFGPYQDAMVADEWALSHSLLSPAINLGLLHPRTVLDRVTEAARERDVPLNSVEGFVRQVLGWREFMRHVYRREMPELSQANQLDQTQPLPPLYWTGETDMACLADVIDGVRTRGYSHHIERLMVLSNFATLLGVEPQALNRWFHAAYVDAFHWVTTPNVVGMGTFGSGVLSTKPYVASANYVDKMSDYCGDCPYYKTKTTGEDACPFNALYWDFLDRNGDHLADNHRMGLVYNHLENKDESERAEIGDRADTLRDRVRREEL